VTHFLNKLHLVQKEVFIVLHALHMPQITLLHNTEDKFLEIWE